MTEVRTIIDVEGHPDLVLLVEEIAENRQPIVLRRNGQDVAVVLTKESTMRGRSGRKLSDDERRAFLVTAGRWRGLAGVDTYVEANSASRRISVRPPVRFE